jgi:hypothetical protein
MNSDLARAGRLAGCLLLLACSPPPPPDAALTAAATATVPPVLAAPDTLPVATASTDGPAALLPEAALGPPPTVHSLMRDVINPAARRLWGAFSYVITAEGEQESRPESDEDWQALRTHADALIRAGLTLKLPTLRVDDGSAPPAAEYQFDHAEVARLIAADPSVWRNYAERMQGITLRIVTAIDRRDATTYTELGVELNQTCEGCHVQFWYRPLQRRVNPP